MKTLGILLILMGTVYNTPPFHTLYNRMIKDFMNGIVLAAERNETDLIIEIFQSKWQENRAGIDSNIENDKIRRNFCQILFRSPKTSETLEARMIISGRIEKVFPKFSTTWFLKRKRNSSIGWIVDEIRTSNLEKRRFGPGESGWETAACATEPLICAILAKKEGDKQLILC
ncbi:hypothetical protein L5515_009398 [Caenorhabditis briggsae]|uniref:Uncharacterized protein n=1 Tax=Caenorhabditis briggsae TaxID=6238 RepID=A0AAE9JNV5_CAEBR|nr:hypothetical protein L5515_009398 [Caenorhabditis briggsae]